MRILFVYPNHGTELRIPLAISILIASLRKAGHKVRLFDTTFLGEFHTDNENMARLGTHKETNLNEIIGETEKGDPKEKLKEEIKAFKPGFICVSLVERNFREARELLRGIRRPVLVGGIMPTIAPEYILNQDWVDGICVGEGEEALPEFFNTHGNYMSNIRNIWVKDYNTRLRPLINLDDVPEQDWSDFDKRHMLKPFMGKVYKSGAFEFSRGCSKSCTFCVAPKLRTMQSAIGKYHRTKTPHKLIQEILNKKVEYGLNMVSFSDTDFLTAPKDKIKDLLVRYARDIRLPFTIQTSVSTLLDEDILKLLKKAQCCAISVGVESGSKRIQKEVLKKVVPIELTKKAFTLCRNHGLRITADYMMGLPYETEQDIHDTIDYTRIVNPTSIAVTYFTPFIGTELYDVCMKEGFYEPFRENIYEYPPLNMPQLSQNRIKELIKEFVDDFKTYQNDINTL